MLSITLSLHSIPADCIALYPRYVRAPHGQQEARETAYAFSMAGFPGCVGSMDATHISLERVPFRLRQPHLAMKMSTTARSYNIIVNHRRQILSTTRGHPATWNDKTLVMFDDFVTGLNTGRYLSNFEFELWDHDGNSNEIKRKYQGAWLLVDNGYHAWSITVPPFKRTDTRREVRFSAWLESMRKDVGCTFGILKGRWRILKSGIRVHGIETADQIWLTCCALHNWLLAEDGLNQQWETGVPSDWAGELGQFDASDHRYIPIAVRRLNNPERNRNYDTSHRGVGDDFRQQQQHRHIPEETMRAPSRQQQRVADGGSIDVRLLTLNQFRSKLVTHFDIAFRRNEIVWPTANQIGDYYTRYLSDCKCHR